MHSFAHLRETRASHLFFDIEEFFHISSSSAPMKIILQSPPSGGRGSHRVRVRERYPQLCYANPHELLRNEIQAKSSFGVQAQNWLKSGTPVPDEEILNLVLRHLKSPACATGFILEGFPQTAEQAERIHKECRRIDAIVEIEIPDKVVIERTSGRMVHKPSGRIYHEKFAPPKVEGRDDITGEALTRRLDDEPSVAAERLSLYRHGMRAVCRYFQGQEPYPELLTGEPKSARVWEYPTRTPVFRTVDGVGSPEEVRGRLFTTLDELVGKRASGPASRRFWWSWFS